jgi:hypothetical protein
VAAVSADGVVLFLQSEIRNPKSQIGTAASADARGSFLPPMSAQREDL